MWSALRRVRDAWRQVQEYEAEFDRRSAQVQQELQREINLLPIDEAKQRAEGLLGDPAKFAQDQGAVGGDAQFNRLAPLLRDCLQKYGVVEDVVGGCWIARSELRPSDADPEFIRIGIGWSTDAVQLWVRPGEETVYLRSLEFPPEERGEAAFTSIYHFLLYVDRLNAVTAPLDH